MTVSMRVMSAGDGYKYLLRTVAVGDGDRSLSTPLTRYYNAEGTPPGRWMGSGLPALGTGQIRSGDVVSEAQLQLLVGMGRDPVTGAPLGRAYPVYKTVEQRIDECTATLDPHLDPATRAAQSLQSRPRKPSAGRGGRLQGSISRSRSPNLPVCCGRSRMQARNP